MIAVVAILYVVALGAGLGGLCFAAVLGVHIEKDESKQGITCLWLSGILFALSVTMFLVGGYLS